MNFLELATAIDQAETEVHQADLQVVSELSKIDNIKIRHETELGDALVHLTTAKQAFNEKSKELSLLFSELQHKMPGAAPPIKAEPTSSELKDLFQAGTKFRGKLS